MSQHASLSPERWASFSLDQQILMIGNEMNRASRWMLPEDRRHLELSWRSLRRELLRWRDVIAELYIRPEADPSGHRAAFRVLLQLTPVAAQQIPYVLD